MSYRILERSAEMYSDEELYEIEKNDQLCRLCLNGDLYSVNKLILENPEVCFFLERALRETAVVGITYVMDFLIMKGAQCVNTVLIEACQRGDLVIAQWAEKNGANQYKLALEKVCRFGSVPTADWLAERMSLDMLKTRDSWFLWHACHTKNKPMQSWLIEHGAVYCQCGKAVQSH